MTYVFDNPASFTEDALSGFLDVYSAEVVGVRGGVVRATATRPGKVAVVVGGGSGHYPAFCGLVGPGFADGAVVGNIFTSPSADDAVSVGAEVEAGAGLVFITGNYAGDVMNFTQAQQRLTADGIDTRVLFVTDDIASAPSDDVARRRDTPMTAPALSVSRSTGAPCPGRPSGCSPFRGGRSASDSGSTASPACRRSPCRRRARWPSNWSSR